MSDDRPHLVTSPLHTYLEFCEKNLLAYQWDEQAGKSVFYPRLVAPETGHGDLTWRVSAGYATVYASTVVYEKGQPSHNVCLVEVDEGYRMMSRVEGIDPLDVTIGLRVEVRFRREDVTQPPYPVFVPSRGV